jgi:hypothetical protein
MEDILLSKFIELNEKTNSYLKLMNNYQVIVDNIDLYYKNKKILKIKEFEDFKQDENHNESKKQFLDKLLLIKQEQKEKYDLKHEIEEKISLDKIKYLNKYSKTLKNNFKEYLDSKKN